MSRLTHEQGGTMGRHALDTAREMKLKPDTSG
jgi:hypothetical protein